MSRIQFSPEMAEEYAKLEKKSERNGDARYVFKILGKGIAKIIVNPESGSRLPRRLWPKLYVQKYRINNLWKLRLDSYWRLLYTLRPNSTEIVSFLIEYKNHRDYDKMFGFDTS